jgi:ribosomal protein S18 acetylase RimI-like enzyme
LLWVSENLRNNGIGKKLLLAAEQEAMVNMCKIILIRSYGFQAPTFYEKNGYKIEHVINNFPDD